MATNTWHYDVGIVLDNDANPLKGVTGIYRLATPTGPGAIAGVTSTSGEPATIRSSEMGTISRFNVTVTVDPAAPYLGAWGYLDFNGVLQPVASIEVLNALPAAMAAQTAAEQARDSLPGLLADFLGSDAFIDAAQDAAAILFTSTVQGTGVTVAYDDVGGHLLVTVAAPSGTAGLDIEGVQDVFGSMVTQAGGTYNDALGTVTFPASSGGGTATFDAEAVRDAIADATRSSGYVTVTANDSADTITFGSSTALQTALDSKATLTAGRLTLAQAPTNHLYNTSYASAYAQPSLAAFLTSIGAPGRTDFAIRVTGQFDTDPDIAWLRDPQDETSIGPAS